MIFFATRVKIRRNQSGEEIVINTREKCEIVGVFKAKEEADRQLLLLVFSEILKILFSFEKPSFLLSKYI